MLAHTHTHNYVTGPSNNLHALVSPALLILSITAVVLFGMVCVVVGTLFRKHASK